MPYHVPDSRLAGRQRAQKRTVAKGGHRTWRNYHPPVTPAPKPVPPAESWWLGLDREQFAAAAQARDAATRSSPQRFHRVAKPEYPDG